MSQYMQSRAKSGTDFEKSLCESRGYRRESRSPKINWPGIGSNLYKIKSKDFDFTQFEPTSGSTYDKWDAVTPEGSKREIKKYKIEQIQDWRLYSEPIFKICTNASVETITRIYGDGNLDVGRYKYNTFIENLFSYLGDTGVLEEIVVKLTAQSDGIEFEDGFIPKKRLEYRWAMKREYWQGFHRIMIEFKEKDRDEDGIE